MLQAVSSEAVPESREREARLLADLVRLSPSTLLLAESGSDKSSFLAESVMPLLATSAAGQTEICVLFDSWATEPLPALLAQIRRAIPVLDKRSAADDVPSTSLVATLARWQSALGATFIVILDRFEEHLADRGRPGGPEFEDELVRVLGTPELHTHFVVALDDDAAPRLESLRERIPGFGDTVIRLPPPTKWMAPAQPDVLAGEAAKHEPLVGSVPPEDLTPSVTDVADFETPVSPEALGVSGVRRAANEDDARPAEAVREPVPAEPAATSVRLPRAAWGVLALLVVSVLGLLLLTIWQPKPRPVDTASQALPRPVAAPTPTPSMPDTSTSLSMRELPPSPADDQVPLPLIRKEVPRAEVASTRPPKTATTRAAPVPRPISMVYIHVRSESQRAWAEQLIQPLARRGVRVTGIRVVSTGPGETDLRYFRRQEAAEAARVARALRDVGVPQPRVKHVAGLESRATPRQYELWVPPASSKPPRASSRTARQHP
jgi:hypothetical protein